MRQSHPCSWNLYQGIKSKYRNIFSLHRATSFPKWYATPNQIYYGLWNQDFNQDVKNITRVNRQDLYSVEYFRQPFWMVSYKKNIFKIYSENLFSI